MSTTMIHGVECELVRYCGDPANQLRQVVPNMGYENHVCAMCPNYERRERAFCGPCPGFHVYVPVGYAVIIKLALA
jgi:hypothetical protein